MGEIFMYKLSKKLILVFIFLFAFTLVNAQAQNAEQPLWTADIVPICEGVCLEGNEANWLVEINNVGQVNLQVFQLILVDNQDIPFGVVDLSNEDAVVPAGQSATVYVSGIVPPPSRGSTLFYKINYVVNGQVYPDVSFRRMYVMPLSEVECTSNAFCEKNEICAAYRCTPYSLFNSSEVPKPKAPVSNDAIQTILLSLATLLLVLLVVVIVKKKHK
jgi:hypothetical protein